MENETFLRAASAVANNMEGQAEVAVSEPAAVESQVGAEMAVEQPASVDSPQEPVAVEQPEPTPSVSEPYNYWPDLDKRTEGAVKDEDSFNSFLEKAKNYDTIFQEKEQLEKNQFKPANDYIAKLNEMTLAGASNDQINAYVRLNSYGDLGKLEPIEAKVLKMVLVDGYDESIARKILGREFNLEQFDETDPDQKDEADILKAQLSMSAKKDLQDLENYKKDLSVVHNPEKEQAEQANLLKIKEMTDYNRTVDRESSNIAKYFPEKLNYEFKVGEDTVAYEENFDKQFLEKDLALHIAEYFRDSGDPVNQDTISEAYSFAMGEYLKANDSKRLERAYQKGDAAGFERAVQKYENRSGLPKAQDNQVVITTEEGMGSFMRKMVGRQ